MFTVYISSLLSQIDDRMAITGDRSNLRDWQRNRRIAV
jgi:hypothetical protein